MLIVDETRDHMPMQMGRHVTEGGKIDFVGLHRFSERFFRREYDGHEMRAIPLGQIRHLAHVVFPDHAAEPAIIGIVDENDSAAFVLPQQFAAGLFTEFAGHCGVIGKKFG